MSVNVAMLEAMKAEGLDLDACIRILRAAGPDTVADKRRAYDRQRKRQKREAERMSGGMSGGNPPDPSPNERDNLTPTRETPDEASASSPVRQPISEATSIWNENAAQVGWPQVKTMSSNRERLLSARLRQHGLDGWCAVIAKARASPYLAGNDPPSWFTFPWLIKAENFLKTFEGNYDRRRTDQSSTLGRHQPADGLSSTARAALQVFGR